MVGGKILKHDPDLAAKHKPWICRLVGVQNGLASDHGILPLATADFRLLIQDCKSKTLQAGPVKIVRGSK